MKRIELVGLLVFVLLAVDSSAVDLNRAVHRSEYLAKYQIVSWWKKTNLVWQLENHAQSLSFNLTWLAFAKAFGNWEPLSQMSFSPTCMDLKLHEAAGIRCVRKAPDIRVRFMTPHEHAETCQHEFGETTLAHAFYPPIGLAHFNSHKAWFVDIGPLSIQPSTHKRQFNLVTVGKVASF